jgi:hypothetical protein
MIEAMAADPTTRIARARTRYDRAYTDLIAAIREDVEAGVVSVTEAARQAGWSRYYIGQIRDGAAGDSPPRHHQPGGRQPGRRRSPARDRPAEKDREARH